MSLVLQTFLLAACMALFCVLPLFSAAVRKQSRILFLMGTGALFGICFFDLVPDVFALGGSSSLYIMGGVWLLYSVVHLFHLQHHHHPGSGEDGSVEPDPDDHGHVSSTSAFLFFFGSLLAHCFASGMLLAVSQDLPGRLARTVFVALLAHKTYESLLLTSILLEKRRALSRNLALIALYALALPVGVATTSLFRASLTQSIAVLVSSVAVGTLLGCLIFDFMIPAARQLRSKRTIAIWMLAGLVLTRLVMLQL